MAHIIMKQNAINQQDNSYISIDKLTTAARIVSEKKKNLLTITEKGSFFFLARNAL